MLRPHTKLITYIFHKNLKKCWGPKAWPLISIGDNFKGPSQLQLCCWLWGWKMSNGDAIRLVSIGLLTLF